MNIINIAACSNNSSITSCFLAPIPSFLSFYLSAGSIVSSSSFGSVPLIFWVLCVILVPWGSSSSVGYSGSRGSSSSFGCVSLLLWVLLVLLV